MSIKHSTKNFLQLASSKILIQLIQLLTIPIILRYYMPHEYGKIALYSSLYSIYLLFVGFTETTKIRFSRDEFELTGKVTKSFWGTFLLRLPFILAFIVFVLVKKELIINYTELPPSIIPIIIISIITSSVVGSSQFLLTQEKFGVSALINLSRIFIRLLFIVLLVTRLADPTAILMIIFTLIGTIIIDILALFVLWKKIGFPKIDLPWTKQMLIFSLPFLLVIASGLTEDNIDYVIIKKYLSFEELGIYSVAYKIFGFGIVPFIIMNSVITPKIITLYNSNDIIKLKTFFGKILPQLSFMLSQVITLVTLFSPLLIYFVGEKYGRSIPVIAMLLGSLSWFAQIYLGEVYFVASKKTSAIIIYSVVMAAVNIVLDILLIPGMGIIAGGICTFLARFAAFCISAYYFQRHLSISNYFLILYHVPSILASVLVAWQISYLYSLPIVVLSSILAWRMAYKTKFFNLEGLEFFKQIGMPKFFEKIFIRFYLKLV